MAFDAFPFRFAAMLAFFLIGPRLAEPADLADWAPPSAKAFIQIRDLESLQRSLEETLFWGLWGEEAEGRLFAALRRLIAPRGVNAPEGRRPPLEEIQALFPRQAALFISDFRVDSGKTAKRWADLGSSIDCDIGLIAQHNGDKDRIRTLIERALLNAPTNAVRTQDTIQGAELFTVQYATRQKVAIPRGLKGRAESIGPAAGPDDGLILERPVSFQYAFVDDCLLLCQGRAASIRDLIANAQSQSPYGLRQSPGFARVLAEFPSDCDVLAYVDGAGSLGQWEGLSKGLKNAYLPALRLEEISAAGLGAKLRDPGAEIHAAVLAPGPKQGLARILFMGEEIDFRSLEAAPADAIAYCGFGIGWKDLWQSANDLLAELLPSYKEVIVPQLNAIESQIGISVGNDLIGSLGPECACFACPSDGADGQPFVIAGVIEAREPQRLESAALGLLRFAGRILQFSLAAEEYGETRIWRPISLSEPLGAEPPAFAFAVASGFVIVSSRAEAVKAVVDQLSSGGERSLGHNAEFLSLVSRLPAKRSALGYFNSMRLAQSGNRLLEQSNSVLGQNSAALARFGVAAGAAIRTSDILHVMAIVPKAPLAAEAVAPNAE